MDTNLQFLLQNILPDHVASYYLTDGRTDELYAKMHNMCGVMFASIPNFQDFYSEDIENGKACIRILNEIICDFGKLILILKVYVLLMYTINYLTLQFIWI